MILSKLQLQNFRNYQDIELKFNTDVNKIVLLANNATGKTNILEAIYLLALTKSFRVKKYQDLILWGMDFAKVRGEVVKKDDTISVEVFIDEMQKHQKIMKVNDVKVKTKQFIGELNVVFFHPEDLNMLYLSPDLRRKYLDILLSQTNKNYLQAFANYKKAIKQRNSLLNQIFDREKSPSDLDVWDEKLVENGQILIDERKKTVKFLNKYLEGIYRKISGGKEKLEIEYKTNVENEYLETLKKKREKDIRKGTTSVGPHRDDLRTHLNGRDVEEYGSRGEFRTILLALKIAEIRFIEEHTKETPVLLLDDVFSELDPERQLRLLEAFNSCQTIITTTDIVHLENVKEKIHIFELEDRRLVRDYVR
ncbi:MAG: DNA replication/repair protein RecF [Patescibacteria group bacterium]